MGREEKDEKEGKKGEETAPQKAFGRKRFLRTFWD